MTLNKYIVTLQTKDNAMTPFIEASCADDAVQIAVQNANAHKTGIVWAFKKIQAVESWSAKP